MLWNCAAVVLTVLPALVTALRYDPEHVLYNLNQNQTATEPTDYWGQWDNHTYNPSPTNWRFPFYILTVDRYVDGDPSNNEANGTVFEHNWMTNQFRFGGDVRGLRNDLDYIQGMGVKVRICLMAQDYPSTDWSSRPCISPVVRSSTCHGQVMVMGHWILLSWIGITEQLTTGAR